MKYLCLVYEDEQVQNAMTREEREAAMGEYMVLGEELERGGRLLAGEELQPVAAATTVRIRNGRVTVTDGPFAETREQLGGFFLVEARDLNEALQLAQRIPAARTGSIEVRPVAEPGAEA